MKIGKFGIFNDNYINNLYIILNIWRNESKQLVFN